MIYEDLGLIIVAAGASRRMNGIDKIWDSLGGRPVIGYSIAELCPSARKTVLVVHREAMFRAGRLFGHVPGLEIVYGGEERQESVRRGLNRLDGFHYIAVHDGARPLVRRALMDDGVALLNLYHGAVPASSPVDTIKIVDREGLIAETLDRSSLQVAQTPQVFRGDALRDAYQRADVLGTDDASLVERAGYSVTVFPGLQHNFKITTPFDFEVAQLLVAAGHLS